MQWTNNSASGLICYFLTFVGSMAEEDVTMGGIGTLETVGVNTNSSSSAQSGDKAKASIPLPQIVSDISIPGQLSTLRRSPSKHEQGRQQATTLAVGDIDQGLKIQTETPVTPSSTRLTVLIKSSPGRPHSPSHPSPSISKMKNAAAATASSSRKQRVKNEPPQNTEPAGQSSAAAAEAAAVQAKTERRGRPKGWKPGMSYADARSEQSAPRGGEAKRKPAPAQGGGEPKRRGRPPRALEASMREQYLQSNPTYMAFFCEWTGPAKQLESGEWLETRCPAQLQNMDTLRKHVYLVHGEDSEDTFICRWKKCGETTASAPVEFPDQESLDEHMEKEHFQPFEWHAGDGVQNKGIDTLKKDPGKLPDYLFKDGVQVTPSVRDQRLEDEQRHRERRRKLKRLKDQNDENQLDEEEYMMQTLGLAQAQQQQEGKRIPSFN